VAGARRPSRLSAPSKPAARARRGLFHRVQNTSSGMKAFRRDWTLQAWAPTGRTTGV